MSAWVKNDQRYGVDLSWECVVRKACAAACTADCVDAKSVCKQITLEDLFHAGTGSY